MKLQILEEAVVLLRTEEPLDGGYSIERFQGKTVISVAVSCRRFPETGDYRARPPVNSPEKS
ncbi:hypothetical protein [Rhodococcus sp. AW25M09]|uniref:hypothetical protein n=1 Tax=Rhodococcus sp. AW25M09 TaxID=1268303 RepID=UPI0012FAFBED|nr:hypothetical protein [Rhodococcus sp. AW25M09]